MRIATWNVNSIRTRMEQLTAWLARAAPDVACLQETKVEDDRFPVEELADAGYQAHFFGQKTYNGVAILVRYGLVADDVKKNLDGDGDGAQRRAIACDGGRRAHRERLRAERAGGRQRRVRLQARLARSAAHRAETHHQKSQPLLVCGDFNVAPEPIDVYDPARWEGHVLFHRTSARRSGGSSSGGSSTSCALRTHSRGSIRGGTTAWARSAAIKASASTSRS